MASLVLAGGFVWMFRKGGLPLVPSSELLAELSRPWVAAVLLTFSVTTLLRTYRWFYLLRPMGENDPWRALGIGLVGYGFVLFAPLRLGEFARPWLLTERTGIPFLTGAMTTGVERIIDGMFVAALLMMGLLFAHPVDPLPTRLGGLPVPVYLVPGLAWTAVLLFGGLALALVAFYWRRADARALVVRVVRVVSPALAERIATQIENIAAGLATAFRRDTAVPYLRDTVLYWAATTLLYYTELRASGVQIKLPEAMVVMGVMGLGSLIPAGPGFFGAHQLSAYCALAMFQPEQVVLRQGALFVFFSYVVGLAVTLLSMMVGLALMSARGHTNLTMASSAPVSPDAPAHSRESSP